MHYQIVEYTSEGFVVHNVDNAEAALSTWNGLEGEVLAIQNDHQETISLTELITIVAADNAKCAYRPGIVIDKIPDPTAAGK